MVKLNIFDTAGQERFKSLTRSYVKGTDAVLFLYDMSKYNYLYLESRVLIMLKNGLSFSRGSPKTIVK